MDESSLKGVDLTLQVIQRLAGRIPHYAQCDVWLTPSRSEGFNLPAMEAMACRTPVVATRTGWPEEAIVQHVNGVLVDVSDVDGPTAGVEWALTLTDPE